MSKDSEIRDYTFLIALKVVIGLLPYSLQRRNTLGTYHAPFTVR